MFVVSVVSGAQEKRLFDRGFSSRQPFGDAGGAGGRLDGTSDGGRDAQRASQRPLGGGNPAPAAGVERHGQCLAFGTGDGGAAVFGAMTAGTCAFPTSNIKTLTKIEMRRRGEQVALGAGRMISRRSESGARRLRGEELGDVAPTGVESVETRENQKARHQRQATQRQLESCLLVVLTRRRTLAASALLPCLAIHLNLNKSPDLESTA